MKKVWDYGTSTPIQRVGVIFLVIGLLSLFSWMIKKDLSFNDLLESYYLPRSRDSFFFHLFFYFIPLGLLMSWGYQILLNIKQWVFGEKPERIEPKSEVKPRRSYVPPKKNLHFKNNPAAFEFASSIYNPDLSIGRNFFGIVREKGTPEDEQSFFIIELAGSQENIFVTGINDKYLELVNTGNIIYWGLYENFGEKRLLDIQAKGYILATLHPEFNPNDGKWVIKNNLTK